MTRRKSLPDKVPSQPHVWVWYRLHREWSFHYLTKEVARDKDGNQGGLLTACGIEDTGWNQFVLRQPRIEDRCKECQEHFLKEKKGRRQ